ncbi:PREDICTED: uncharacterized protein LOC109168915 [Ipomoea nil]|uniref:uncharacterized protein LOC109168915 n=1 Tax=Ipomoea nil TaxID=35883 RepID=UPI0009016F4A|nr:PREDICTED: uncharacterized protein LOC109168915 [Ipomoea nil]
MGGGRSSSSSSGEEDGDADWRAAIDSLAATTAFSSSAAVNGGLHSGTREYETDTPKPQNLKHYQIKAQKLLEDIIEKTIEVVSDTGDVMLEEPIRSSEGGIRLFKHAPAGIVFDHTNELNKSRKKPRILPVPEIDERSKEFRHQIKSVAVDGTDIMAAAKDSSQKSLAKLEAKDAAAKAAKQREEERVAELKRIRGERWLPSIARDMQQLNRKRS